MSVFSELLPKLNDISIAFTKNFNDDLKAAFDCFDKFEEEFQHGRTKPREKAQKDKNHMTTLQSIHEDEDVQNQLSDTQSDGTSGRSCAESNTDKPRRASKKRSKYEVDGLCSPEQDKRQKRNASIKAQTNITKQVNVNLTQKLRREDNDKKSTARHRKEDDKENSEPLLNIEIKEEKISLPPEPENFIEIESLPLNIEIKQEPTKDDMAMPPPMAPVPKSRAKAAAKEKPAETSGEEQTSGKRRTTRTTEQTDTAPAPVAASRPTRASSRSTKQIEPEDPVLPPPQPEPRPKRTRAKKKVSEVAEPEKETQTPVEGLVAASRPTRASSRSTKQIEPEDPVLPPPQPEPRPKRTRAKKKVSEVAEPEKETQTPVEGLGSPAEKPRPKRTRRGAKAAEKAEQNQEAVAPEPPITPKHEPVPQEVSSPTIPSKETKKHNKRPIKIEQETIGSTLDDVDAMDMTRVLGTVNDMDKTVVLPQGVYNHAPVTPKNVRTMDETIVIEAGARETIVLSKPQTAVMDATVVLEKEQILENITDDNSLLTDDSEMHTPPKQESHQVQPTSAVKEKVQQFEELASRETRTKTRAMAKKQAEEETHTPPDKIVKQILSVETLNKMNNMIFNGKQISSSATKPSSNIPTAKPVPASTSKLSSINKAREEAEARREKEDARKKKEAILQAKREMHKRKREEKMAAAAAAREAAERSRRAAMEAAARERVEKQAHADLGKLERLKEAERKKIELARKVAETEERRRAEEIARQQRLAEEQRRADEARKKQLEEAAATKKEAALMTKEMEKKRKEYMEKQKMKQKMEDKILTPLKSNGCALEPVYMADGFQYLNSDEDEEPVERPVSEWCTSKARKQQLCIQSQSRSALIDRLFSVRVHSPDLREIFPNIERRFLKRTSSAVWRTPPARLPVVTE